MHKTRTELLLVNILISIDKIVRNTKDITYEQFVEDERIFALVIRELQEIGESVRKLLEQNQLPARPNVRWEDIRAFRNVVVHEYFGVDPTLVSEIAEKEVPQLEQTILDVIRKEANLTKILQVIDDTKKVYTKLNRRETVAYLEKINGIFST